MSISVPLILILELLRYKFPKKINFVKISQRTAIIGYLGIILVPNLILKILMEV